jgi:acyl carrier protein
MADVRTIVREFVPSECMRGQPESALRDDDALMSTGVLDSIAILRLVALLEQETGIEVQSRDVEDVNFGSVDAIVRYVAQRKS